MTDNEAFELLAQMVAEHVIAKLRDQLTFPTAEDIERIRDHVSPNGIAFQNGVRAGREAAAKIAESYGETWVAEEILDPGCHSRTR